jgi:hypothetical protein
VGTEIGRWTSQDPLGFTAGDSSVYRYAKNHPTLSLDPSGLVIPWHQTATGVNLLAPVPHVILGNQSLRYYMTQGPLASPQAAFVVNGRAIRDGIPAEPFIGPGWISNSNTHFLDEWSQMIQKLNASYSPDSLGGIVVGSHGGPGRAVDNRRTNLFDSSDTDVAVIRSRLNWNAWLAIDACNVARDPQAVSNFAKRLQRPVVAPTTFTDNDEDYSLVNPDIGVWILFPPGTL